MNVMEFYDRALAGKRVTEQEFDMKVLPAKLRQLVKKYEITYNPDEPVPQDLDVARRIFEAAVELLVEVGVYCRDTQSIITIGEEEIRTALRDAPARHIIGEGTEAVECCCRGIGDKRRPVILGGPGGAPLSEENYIDILTSYARESIDGLHTGALQSLFDRKVRANEPIELMACQYEALWAREAVRRAGKPGMSLLGIMSGAGSEAQDAGDFPGGLRTSDMHLISFSNELKANWGDFKKIAHNQNRGNIINACCMPMLGGYCGGPEGTAITAVAEVMQGFVMTRAVSFDMAACSIRFGVSDRPVIWVNCITQLAFISTGVEVLIVPFIVGTAGPCTEMLCDEIAAMAVAQTASGAFSLYGAMGSEGGSMDYTTGMESRILYEIGTAAAGIGLGEANEIVKQLIGRYEKMLRGGEAPLGKSFTQCYEQGLTPSQEYLNIWKKKKKDLEKIGLKFS